MYHWFGSYGNKIFKKELLFCGALLFLNAERFVISKFDVNIRKILAKLFCIRSQQYAAAG